MNLKEAKKQLKKGINQEEALHILLDAQLKEYFGYHLIKLAYEYLIFNERVEDQTKDLFFQEQKVAVKSLIQEGFFSDHSEEKEVLCQRLDAIRNEIAQRLTILTVYADEIEIYEYLLNRLEPHPSIMVDHQSFAGEVVEFIFAKEDNILINDKIKAVLGQLPMRLTRAKFFDYVSESLKIFKGAHKQELIETLEILKTIYAPEEANGYETFFPEIYEGLKKFKHLDYKSLPTGHVIDYGDELSALGVNVFKVIDSYIELMSIVNLLYGLFLNPSSEVQSYYKHALTIIDCIQRNEGAIDISIMDEMMADLEALEGLQEEIFYHILQESGFIEGCFEKDWPQSHMKKYEILQNLEKLSSTSFFANLGSQPIVDEILDDGKIYELITSFSLFLKERFKHEDIVIRRAKLSKLMSTLPVAFKNPQEIYDYILFSLNQCSDNEKLWSIGLIKEIMQDYE